MKKCELQTILDKVNYVIQGTKYWKHNQGTKPALTAFPVFLSFDIECPRQITNGKNKYCLLSHFQMNTQSADTARMSA